MTHERSVFGSVKVTEYLLRLTTATLMVTSCMMSYAWTYEHGECDSQSSQEYFLTIKCFVYIRFRKKTSINTRKIVSATKTKRFLFSAFPKFGRTPSGGASNGYTDNFGGVRLAVSEGILDHSLLFVSAEVQKLSLIVKTWEALKQNK